jgi:CRISPR system Cascade subunit CasA
MTLHFRLLDDRLIRYRDVGNNTHEATLPELLAALTRDTVRDFPALRPHQRHPWHAFLVQLAAVTLHNARGNQPFKKAEEWRTALLALTPDDPDGAAFALVAPDDRPALLQAPCKSGESRSWKKHLTTPDELDMLVTSKNHDIKAARMMHARPEDWLFALVSLQTQEGFLGAGNYGISRMNGGFASRPAFGVVPAGLWGRRWKRDTALMLANREKIVDKEGLCDEHGFALLWLRAWDGAGSVSFAELDPFYIEICRRVRLVTHDGALSALSTSTKAARVAAKERAGVTGDAWTPVALPETKALSITARGFDYKLMSKLAFSSEYARTIAQSLLENEDHDGAVLLAQGVTRGQGKTEGYHERRIPLSREMRKSLIAKQTEGLAEIAKQRIGHIGDVRKVLWSALCALFGNGESVATDDIKKKASDFARPFEANEDRRFFEDLIVEIECEADGEKNKARDQWLCGLVDRAQAVLSRAFIAGPRASVRRYRAQSAAQSRFDIGLCYGKQAPEHIARVLTERREARRRERGQNRIEHETEDLTEA